VIWKRLLAGMVMCLFVMALGRLPIGNSILTLLIQILFGGAFYIAALYLAKDEMLREILNLIPAALRKLTGSGKGY
jgi:hypothetical protein